MCSSKKSFSGISYHSSTYVVGIRGISLKEVRIDRILEGAVGVQEYKNFVNPGSQFKDIPPEVCYPGLTEFLYS